MKKTSLIFTLILFLLTGLFNVEKLHSTDRLTGKMFATRSEVISQHGMVASSQPLAVQIGIDILKQGGSAVDAAIAVNAALGLMEPTSCGIGGDLFAIVWDNKKKKLYGINSSGPSPKKLTLEYFKKQSLKSIPYHGPLPWSVPGCVDGWFKLHKKFGKISMKKILTPAIKYAREGFPISELIASYWGSAVKRFKKYKNFPELYSIRGAPPQKGDIFKNPQLANTYELLGEKGRDVFYSGQIAKSIVKYSKEVGGFFGLSDFSQFQSEWVTPLGVEYKGYTLWELPPNGQGIAALQMLQMLNFFNLKEMGHNSSEYLHTLVEVKKLVYEDRAKFYTDPRFSKIPVKKLLSEEYAKERIKLFSRNRANRHIKYNDQILEHGDTAYMTVADKDGNMVSLIQSNYSGFGSGMCPDNLGFCLQDRGTLFSLQKGHRNVYEPGKRPFHTIIPAFVTKNNQPVFSFGVMGGSMQPQGHIQVLINILEFGMNIQEAGDAPRFRHSGSSQPTGEIMNNGGTLNLESGISETTIRQLLSKGHKISRKKGGYGGYQGIWKDIIKGIYLGGSESRKDGCAIGY